VPDLLFISTGIVFLSSTVFCAFYFVFLYYNLRHLFMLLC